LRSARISADAKEVHERSSPKVKERSRNGFMVASFADGESREETYSSPWIESTPGVMALVDMMSSFWVVMVAR
jgi:hypothetical protein